MALSNYPTIESINKQQAYRQFQWKALPFVLAILDAVMVFLALNLAFFIRFRLNLPIFQTEALDSPAYYINLELVMVAVCLLLFMIAGLYNVHNLLGGMKEYSLILNCITFLVILVLFVAFITPVFIVSRGWLLLTWGLASTMVGVGRFAFRRVVYAMRKRGWFLKRTVIVGANEEGRILAEQLSDIAHSGCQILGFIGEKQSESNFPNGTAFLGNLEQLDKIVIENQVEDIILTTSALSQDQILSIFRKYGISREVTLRLSSGLYEVITTGLQVKELAGVPLFRINHVRLTGLDLILKNLMDYGICLLLLIPLLPLMALISLAILLDSPGPIIHRRKVLGVNGHPFFALKFRTMYVNGDEILNQYPDLKAELERNHKLKIDPRITRVGSFLRKVSLDELPQIFNVIIGQMSLVGPRMISPPEIDEYEQSDMNLLTVKPGITGLWQVSGRSDVTYRDRVRLDMYYIRNWSLWLDLQILFRTIPAVLNRRGAY
jgi:exopolysaccharide biosynthesis polyprenyl glycosylphosphotransferase